MNNIGIKAENVPMHHIISPMLFIPKIWGGTVQKRSKFSL